MEPPRSFDQQSIHPMVYKMLLYDYVRQNRAQLLVYLVVIFFCATRLDSLTEKKTREVRELGTARHS